MSPGAQFMRLIGGYKTTQALYVVSKLGVPDVVGGKALPVREIASKVGANQERLYRVMRSLSSFSVFKEGPHGTFSNTPLSDVLRTDDRPTEKSLKPFALMQVFAHYQPSSYLLDIVRGSKETGAQLAFGKDFFAHINQESERMKTFSDAMSSFSTVFRDGFAQFMPSDLAAKEGAFIVDIGGGSGHITTQILNARPDANAIVLDQQHVRAAFDEQVEKESASVNGRLRFCTGDFLNPTDIPKGADLYVLGMVMHNWDDETCLRILRNIRDSMKPESRLMVLEMVIEDLNEPGPAKDVDLIMLTTFSGKERTREEFSKLFSEAGIKLTQVLLTDKPTCLILGEPDRV